MTGLGGGVFFFPLVILLAIYSTCLWARLGGMRLARTLRVQWLVHSPWPGSLQKLAVAAAAAAASSKQQSRRVLVPCHGVCRREGGRDMHRREGRLAALLESKWVPRKSSDARSDSPDVSAERRLSWGQAKLEP